jgi:hypothetical protein
VAAARQAAQAVAARLASRQAAASGDGGGGGGVLAAPGKRKFSETAGPRVDFDGVQTAAAAAAPRLKSGARVFPGGLRRPARVGWRAPLFLH